MHAGCGFFGSTVRQSVRSFASKRKVVGPRVVVKARFKEEHKDDPAALCFHGTSVAAQGRESVLSTALRCSSAHRADAIHGRCRSVPLRGSRRAIHARLPPLELPRFRAHLRRRGVQDRPNAFGSGQRLRGNTTVGKGPVQQDPAAVRIVPRRRGPTTGSAHVQDSLLTVDPFEEGFGMSHPWSK